LNIVRSLLLTLSIIDEKSANQIKVGILHDDIFVEHVLTHQRCEFCKVEALDLELMAERRSDLDVWMKIKLVEKFVEC